MPPRKKNAKNAALAMADGIDRLGALPDEVLHHVLSFLRAQDAVRTCVLARRWRHLWRFATGLRIGCGEDDWAVVHELREFVDNLFLLRGLTPLVKCEFSFDECRNEDVPRVMLWIKHSIQCEVQMLRLKNIWSDGWPFISQHLTKLDLEDMLLKDKLLNFSSSCPALQNLTLTDCSIECTKISSESLKCLSITKCRFSLRFRTHVCAPSLISLRLEDMLLKDKLLNFSSSCPALQNLTLTDCSIDCTKISSESLKCLSITKCRFSLRFRTHVCAPSLISLRLEDHWYKTPVLEGMPSLVDAIVRVIHDSADCCTYSNYGDCGFEVCEDCYGDTHDNDNCVLLEGLSEAKSLALVAETKTFIFTRDLKRYPTFSKLKTLLLNEYWCLAPGFSALTCILKHTPVLEKLTLQLFSKGHKHEVEMKGRYISMQKSAAISEHLKTVEVKCKAVGLNVVKVLKFLCTFGIYFCFE